MLGVCYDLTSSFLVDGEGGWPKKILTVVVAGNITSIRVGSNDFIIRV